MHIAFAMVLFCPSGAATEEIDVRVEVESQDVYVGEYFLMQLVVDGSDKAQPPDLSELEGFVVEYLGGSNNSSQSISIINGRIQRVVRRGFVFTYRLTPTTMGKLTIPSISIEIEGQTFSTRSLTIAVRRPTETEDFKLRIKLSRETCYIGEPVVLTVVWYLRRDVQDFYFTVPVLGNNAFGFEDPEIAIDRKKKYYRIQIGDKEVIAEKGRGILDGVSYATLEFGKVLIPRRSGTFVVPEVVVACEAVTESGRRRDFFDDFFNDDFFRMGRGRLKKYVVPSNTLSLRVIELPSEGRPTGFSGHIGQYRISASAEPTEVNVGDPITLKIVLSGPDYLGSVDLPPLAGQPELTGDFKIPDDRADGKVEGKKKIFSQTIRAKHADVEKIPPIKLVYFDTAEKRYTIVQSDPIPITVHETRVVTALDAEGIDLGTSGMPVQKWKDGIAFNYEGPGTVVPQDFGLGTVTKDSAWLIAFIAPPSMYLLLLAGVIVVRRRKADPDALKSRSASKRLKRRLDSMAREKDLSPAKLCEDILEALRDYLGDKFRCMGSTLTAVDVERFLGDRGVPPKVIETLKGVMNSCETGTYAGDTTTLEDLGSLIKKVREAVGELEKSL